MSIRTSTFKRIQTGRLRSRRNTTPKLKLRRAHSWIFFLANHHSTIVRSWSHTCAQLMRTTPALRYLHRWNCGAMSSSPHMPPLRVRSLRLTGPSNSERLSDLSYLLASRQVANHASGHLCSRSGEYSQNFSLGPICIDVHSIGIRGARVLENLIFADMPGS